MGAFSGTRRDPIEGPGEGVRRGRGDLEAVVEKEGVGEREVS